MITIRRNRVLGALLALLLFHWTILVQASDAIQDQQATNTSQSPASQNTSPASGATNAFGITNHMVVVDVVVTDGSGKPVTGLKPEDFQIFENGKVEQIRAFGVRSPETQHVAVAAPQHFPPGIHTNIIGCHPEDGPLTIVLIDSLNTPYFDQLLTVRAPVIQYLQGIGPRKNLLVFTLGMHLGVMQSYNADPQLLQQALQRASSDPLLQRKSKPRAEADEDSRIRSLAQELLIEQGDDKENQIVQLKQSWMDFFTDSRVERVPDPESATLHALTQIGHYVLGCPGRKNLIWLSQSFPGFHAPGAPGRRSTKGRDRVCDGCD